MADWSKPSLTDAYAAVLAEIMARDLSTATLSYSNDANIPNGAIRWNPNTFQFEIFSSSGGNWTPWSTQINVGTLLLGQNAAPDTMQALPRQQADTLYAGISGSKTQPFFAANATDPQHATPLNQIQTLITNAISILASQNWTATQIATAVASLASQSWTTVQITAAVATLPSQSAVTQQIATAIQGMATQSWVDNLVGQIPAGLQGIYLANTAANTTITIPAKVTKILLRLWGGGGGGGWNDYGGSDGTVFGGAGGTGGYVEAIMPVTPGQQYPITIGGEGAGNPSYGAGGSGGTSYFGSLASASGGGGGGTGQAGTSSGRRTAPTTDAPDGGNGNGYCSIAGAITGAGCLPQFGQGASRGSQGNGQSGGCMVIY